MVVNLYEHQAKAVAEMHNGCVLWGGVGTGKSLTSLAYFVSEVCQGEYGKMGTMKNPMDLVVITTAKKRDSQDWENDAVKFMIPEDRSMSGDGICIRVDSWNNIEKYKNFENTFFIFDEQRVVGSGEWTKSFIRIAKKNPWVLLSATPGDTWLDYIPVFVANGYYKNRTEFKREHVVYSTYAKFPKVERYLGVNKLVKLKNKTLVHMPYDRHTVRHDHQVEVSYDRELFKKVMDKRWHVYEERPIRDPAELFSVMRKVANSDPSRPEKVQELLEKHPKLIVFYNFNYELEALRLLTAPSQIAWNGLETPESTRPQSRSKNGASAKERSGVTQLRLAPGTGESDSKSTRTSTEGLTGTIWESGFNEKAARATALIGGNTSVSGSKSTPTPRKSSKLSVVPDLSTQENNSGEWSTSNGTSTEEISFAIAEWNGHKHQPIPKTDSWVYLVQYTAGAEGWNCVETNAVVFYSLNYSYKITEQAHGRIDRLNTPFVDLHYYTLISRSFIDRAVSKALKMKKNFNEKSVKITVEPVKMKEAA